MQVPLGGDWWNPTIAYIKAQSHNLQGIPLWLPSRKLSLSWRITMITIKLFSDLLYTILIMSCGNYFLRTNKLATTSVPVMDCPYRNYNLSIFAKTLFIACCTKTFINTVVALGSLRLAVILSYHCCIVYCLLKLLLTLRLWEFFNKEFTTTILLLLIRWWSINRRFQSK